MTYYYHTSLLLLCLSIKSTLVQGNININSDSIIVQDNYDPNMPPIPKSGDPLLVNVSICLTSIVEINEPKQMITIEAILRFNWTDHRVDAALPDGDTLGYALSTKGNTDTLWYPDILMYHAKDTRTPHILSPPSYLRVYPGGRMFYAILSNYDVSCPMNFQNYPVDTQNCQIILESFGMTSRILELDWDETTFLEDNIHLNQHEASLNFSKSVQEYVTGSFPQLIMNIKLKRNLNYHAVRTYLPSFLFVTLAWMSILIPIEHLPARIGLSITTLLTLAAMFGSLSSVTPPVSYTTKLDIWIIGCFVFVSFILMETAIVVHIKFNCNSLFPICRNKLVPKTPSNAWTVNSKKKHDDKIYDGDNDLASKIDKICVMISFAAFIIFCCYYWLDLVT